MRRSPVGHDFDRLAVRSQRPGEEPTCRQEVAPGRDIHIDDLPGLIHGPVHIAPSSGDLHVGLVYVSTVRNWVAARPSRVCEERREVLDPPVDRDVVDLDPALAEKLLDVAIRQPVTQIPAHGEDDDLRREPEPGEC